jgi:Lar family restriction alleviation protein
MPIVNTNSSSRLEPCPFCGTTPNLRTETSLFFKKDNPLPNQMYWVKCPNAECAVSPCAEGTEADAVAHWNRRAA